MTGGRPSGAVVTAELDPFQERVSLLADYLARARSRGKGAILFAVWKSIVARRVAEAALEEMLQGRGLRAVRVEAGAAPAGELVASLMEATASPEEVLFVHGLEQAGQDGLRSLNYQREAFVERPLRAAFWLREPELQALARRAPDFWRFRHLAVDFPEMPQEASFPEALRPLYRDIASDQRIQELQERVTFMEGEVDALKRSLYGAGKADVTTLRTISREQAKQEILGLFASSEVLDQADIAERLLLDLALVNELCMELIKEGEVTYYEDGN